jgi:hypothetical protein
MKDVQPVPVLPLRIKHIAQISNAAGAAEAGDWIMFRSRLRD